MRIGNKKLERLANISILILLILAGAGLVKRFLFAGDVMSDAGSPAGDAVPAASDATSPAFTPLARGDKLLLPDVDWAKNGQTLLLVFSPDCDYCNASIPFFKRLGEEAARHKNIRLIGVSPEDIQASKKYLKDSGVAINEVKQIPLKSIGLKFTPTLILADKEGAVKDALIGQLPPEKEVEVLSWLKAGAPASKNW